MNWVDIVIVVVLILAAVSGWRAGLLPGLGLLAGILVGIPVAGRSGEALGSLMLRDSGHAWLLGFVIIMALAIIAGLVLGLFLQRVVRTLWLGWLDQIGGAVAGLALAALVLTAVLTAAASSSRSPEWASAAVEDSRLASQIVEKGSFVKDMIAEEL